MKHCVTKLRSPVKWHGGKSYLARRFIGLFPEHEAYLEPFAGGLSTLLNKPRCGAEIASDLDAGLIRMWTTLRDRGEDVSRRLRETPYSEVCWIVAKRTIGSDLDLDHAWAFIVSNRMSRGGLGKDFAWSERLRGKRRPDGPVPGELNSWHTFVHVDLPRVVERIQGVEFACGYAFHMIVEADPRPGMLIYADPPYLHGTRSHKKAYFHEMDADQHRHLLVDLDDARCKGAKVFLSGYRSELYNSLLDAWGWGRHEFDMPNHSGQGKTKQRRVECLWESP